MTNSFRKSMERACIYVKDNMIMKANQNFLQLIGYKYNDIVERSIMDLSILLRCDFQMPIQDIEDMFCLYIFTSDDLPIEVKIKCEKIINKDIKVYYFEKQLDLTLDWILYNIDNIDVNKNESMAVFSYSDCILLKYNQNYISTLSSMEDISQNLIGRYPSFPNHILNLFKQGISFHERDTQFIDSDGLATYWDINTKVISMKDSNKYFVSYFNDVTDKVIETDLVKKRADIMELILANKQMEKILKAQEETFVNTSHELKTPLNLIFSASQLLNMLLKGNVVEDIKENIMYSNQIILQNCYRLTKLINNILDISKIEAGFYELNLSNYNIVDILDNIVQSVSDYTKSRGLKIVFECEVEEIIMSLDVFKFERVILNLISNAIKFSDNEGTILVKIVKRNGMVEISVSDNGVGIEEHNLDILFKKFIQVNKSLKRSSEGTGIGLSLVKSITELHGGSINVKSTIGKGSVFTIILPMKIIDDINITKDKLHQNDKIEMIKFEFSDIYSY